MEGDRGGNGIKFQLITTPNIHVVKNTNTFIHVKTCKPYIKPTIHGTM